MKEFWIQIFKCSGMGNLIKIEFFFRLFIRLISI